MLLQSLILAMYYLFRYQPTTKKHPVQVFPVADAAFFSLQKKDLPVWILFQKACLCTGFPVQKGFLLNSLNLLEVLLQTSFLDGSSSNIFLQTLLFRIRCMHLYGDSPGSLSKSFPDIYRFVRAGIQTESLACCFAFQFCTVTCRIVWYSSFLAHSAPVLVFHPHEGSFLQAVFCEEVLPLVLASHGRLP